MARDTKYHSVFLIRFGVATRLRAGR